MTEQWKTFGILLPLSDPGEELPCGMSFILKSWGFNNLWREIRPVKDETQEVSTDQFVSIIQS